MTIMGLFTQVIIFALHIYGLMTIQEDILMPGDAVLAGLLEVNIYQDGSCRNINPKSVLIHEAVRWFFRQLNERNYILNVTLGFHAFRTCGQPSSALQQTLKMLDQYNNEQGPYLIGLLGPERSSETQPVSRLLSSLPVEDRLPQISFSATAASLKDRSVYKNLFRIIQTDDMQVQVLVKLMIALEWNYIGVIFEDDAYGRGAAEDLKTQAETMDICIPVFAAISVEASAVERRTQFATIVNQLEKESESPVLGVLFFGRGSTAEDMFQYIGLKLKLTNFQLIVSEALALDQVYVLNNDDTIYPRAKGLLTPSPPYYDVELFQQFWRDVHINDTLMLQQLQNSDWFVQYMKDIVDCQLPNISTVDNSCIEKASQYIETNNKLPVFLHYAVLGAATFAKAFKDLHEKECGSMPGLCPSLRGLLRSKLITAIEGLNLSTSTDFDYELPSLNLSYGFQNGSIVFDRAEELSTYDVYNLKSCDDAFCFTRVGSNINKQFSLSVDAIRSFAKNGDEIIGAVEAQCQPSFKCTMCTRTGRYGNTYFIPGDYYIVGLVPIHNRKANSLECGDIRESSLTVDIAEAAVFALKTLNKRNGFSKEIHVSGNVTFGLVLIDTCVHPYVTQERVMAFQSGTLKLANTLYSSEILDKVIGYVGPAHSSVTVPFASVMNEVKKLYISYSALSATLSNRQRFPYFMRICSADYKQTNVIMELTEQMSAKYVQIIYSDDEYGIAGKDALLAAAKEREICVAQIHLVPDTTDTNKFQGYISDIRRYPHARVIIVFLLPHTFPGFMGVLNEDMDFGEFAFIGGDGWAQRAEMLVNDKVINTKLRGSLTITQKLPKHLEFEQYFQNLNIEESSNPWLQNFMEARTNCYFPKSFNKQHGTSCTPTLIAQHRQSDTWVPFTINTVYALALGFDAAVSSICGGLIFCREYSTEKLIEYVKRVHLDIYNNNNSIRVFDDNGEGNVGYTISQVVKVGQNLDYREVGLSTEDGIRFLKAPSAIKSEMDFTSFCQNEVECTRCSSQFGNETESSSYTGNDDVPIATISLSIVVGLLFLTVSVISALYILRKRKVEGKDDPYLSVVPDPRNDYEVPMRRSNSYIDNDFDQYSTTQDTHEL